MARETTAFFHADAQSVRILYRILFIKHEVRLLANHATFRMLADTTLQWSGRLVADGHQGHGVGTRTAVSKPGLAWYMQQCVTWCMTWCFTTAFFCTAAHAENPREQVCQRSGALASAVAQARDRGMAQTAAVTAVAATATPDEQAMVLEAAHLLYERFRQMTPESAEFEFTLDCLDGAD
jgi:GNAT superfamily N-acetyltransferase